VSASDLQPGDLVFYGSPIHHVGMYIGGGQIVDALNSGTPVGVRSIGYPGTVSGYGRP
jgi:cell wall-associated NlpC family hydrolase